MAENRRYYKSDDINVSFNPRLCIHAAECVRGLPEVFDPKKRPWIEPANASANEIAEVVKRCPSGALKFESRKVQNENVSEAHPSIIVRRNGPIYFRGDIEICDSNGNPLAQEGRVALCRCGASKNKPYCDNSHLEIKFNAE